MKKIIMVVVLVMFTMIGQAFAVSSDDAKIIVDRFIESESLWYSAGIDLATEMCIGVKLKDCISLAINEINDTFDGHTSKWGKDTYTNLPRAKYMAYMLYGVHLVYTDCNVSGMSASKCKTIATENIIDSYDKLAERIKNVNQSDKPDKDI